MKVALALLVAAVLALGCGSTAARPTDRAADPDETVLPMDWTPEPDPTLDPAVALMGTIEFGTALDEEALTITKPATVFKTKVKKIAWVAHLLGTADTTTLTFVLASVSKSGVEKTIIKTDVDVSNPGFDTLGNSADLAALLDRKPGTYAMRYLREGTVLAEGTFTLKK